MPAPAPEMCEHDDADHHGESKHAMKQNEAVSLRQRKRRKVFDWLSEPRPEHISSFQKFILDGVDWATSPLGPIPQWPTQLKQMVVLIERDPTPAVIYWGDEPTAIVYNEPYSHIVGQCHPALQGNDPKIVFRGWWERFESLLATQREDFESVIETNALVMLDRHNFWEEAYFSWKFVPLIGEKGYVVGSYVTVVETTRDVLCDRRNAIVSFLTQELAQARNSQDLWRRTVAGLRNAGNDILISSLYSIQCQSGSISSRDPIVARYILQGCTGIERGHKITPDVITLKDSDPLSLSSFVRKSVESKEIVVAPLTQQVEWRGHGTPTQMAVCPIISTDTESCLAVLVIVLNPGRPFNNDYRHFVELLTQQIIAPKLSAALFREEGEKREKTAQQETAHREELLKELSESELNLTRITARAPFGLGILKTDGSAVTVNELWKDLTRLGDSSNAGDWEKVLMLGELARVSDAWERVITGGETITMQTSIDRPWKAPDVDIDGNDQYNCTHILLSMYPNFDENGKVASVMSCLTDISEIKWSERQLRKRMEEAIEMKKQQERFIDMTSHEMRNPLSALIGCADEIIASLRDYCDTLRGSGTIAPSSLHPGSEMQPNAQLLDDSIEAANTIIYCAMHQKRIIDDILTLSRLDSNLLPVSPEPSEPINLIRSAMKMFESELKHAGIKFDFIEEDSLKTLDVQWTLLDPSRVLQVLINLMTNAIKFTRSLDNSQIKIMIGASLSKPSETNEFGVEYVAKSKNSSSQDQTTKPEWGDGEILYINVTVKDTGCGLSSEEKANLFRLFKQGNPKTHVQYGGSGLGLFISRQLVEMQGGEIGVWSALGKGSTFHFYIKTRRTDPPQIHDVSSSRDDIQLLVNQDALREACGVQIPAVQEVIKKVSELKIGNARPEPPYKSPTRAYSSYHILVVEDNLVNQKVVTKQLRKAGHSVSVANHGGEAMGFIQSSDFWAAENSCQDSTRQRLDVVLMDLEMPIMDGMTCVRRIREFQRAGQILKHVPVLAVTANARKEQILSCIEAGMDDVTTKPYRMKDMLRQIEKLVSKHLIGRN